MGINVYNHNDVDCLSLLKNLLRKYVHIFLRKLGVSRRKGVLPSLAPEKANEADLSKNTADHGSAVIKTLAICCLK